MHTQDLTRAVPFLLSLFMAGRVIVSNTHEDVTTIFHWFVYLHIKNERKTHHSYRFLKHLWHLKKHIPWWYMSVYSSQTSARDHLGSSVPCGEAVDLGFHAVCSAPCTAESAHWLSGPFIPPGRIDCLPYARHCSRGEGQSEGKKTSGLLVMEVTDYRKEKERTIK